jgi:hypothetical protein
MSGASSTPPGPSIASWRRLGEPTRPEKFTGPWTEPNHPRRLELAGGPLAAAIAYTPEIGHRAYMLGLLRAIGSFADPLVFDLLRRMAQKGPHPVIELMAGEILEHLAKRHAAAEMARMALAGARPEEGTDGGSRGMLRVEGGRWAAGQADGGSVEGGQTASRPAPLRRMT